MISMHLNYSRQNNNYIPLDSNKQIKVIDKVISGQSKIKNPLKFKLIDIFLLVVMYEADMESAFIQSITSYLQYFKTYFGLVLQLIECHLFRDKLAAHLTIQSAVQKITLKKLDMKLQLSPFLLRITQTNKSYIDRFYMRIVQYLEYRLNNMFKSNEIDPKFPLIVNQFMSSLHKIFKTIIGQLNNKESAASNLLLGNVFYQVELCVKRMFEAVFRCLEMVIGNGEVDLTQEIRLSRSTVEEHILGPFYSYLMSFIHGEEQDPESKKVNSHDQDKIDNKTRFNLNNHYRSKSQFNIQTLHILNSKSLKEHRFLVGNRSQDSYSNKTELGRSFELKHNMQNGQKGQLIQKKSHKSAYSEMLGIMQIQPIQLYSRQYIMEELKAKNIRNKQMISKFIKLYKKKQKKPKKKLSIVKKEDYAKYEEQYFQEEYVLDDTHTANDQDKSVISNQQNTVDKVEAVESDHNFTLKDKIIAICSSHNQQPKQRSLRPSESSQLTTTPKLTPNPRLQSTVKQPTLIHPVIAYNSQFQSNKDAFLYKQGEKLCFEQLRHKMNLQFQKVSSPLQFKKDFTQLEALKKMNRVPGQKIVSEELREKASQRSLSKRTTIKGPNFSSFVVNQTRNNSKSCHSNSQMLQKNHSLNSNLQTLTSSSLECSSFNKVNPKHLVIKSILQNQQISRDSKFQTLIRIDDKMKRNSQMQNPMVMLPRIFVGQIKKNYNKIDKL